MVNDSETSKPARRYNRAAKLAFDEDTIDAMFAPFDNADLPGVAVGIAVGGRPVYEKAFGSANIELPVALSPKMRMRIGSTSKHFTCLLWLLLCEEGLITLDDPIGRYLPELGYSARGVTIRQLMTHMSGLRDVFDIAWQFSGTGHPVTSEELLALYCAIDDVNAPPGATWCYNNSGWLLIGSAIERITGSPLESALRHRIFEPVGMLDTELRRWDHDFLPNSATLHTSNPAGAFEKSYLGTASGGEGGIVSTIGDMLRWLAHMDDPVVGTRQSWSTLKAAQKLGGGRSTGYGLGLVNGEFNGIPTLFHAGGVLGGNSQMLKVPDVQLDLVVILNRSDVSATKLVNGILAACLEREAHAVIASDRMEGCFRSAKSGRVIQLLEVQGQQIASIDGLDWPMDRVEGTLQQKAENRHIRYRIIPSDEAHAPRSIAFDEFGIVDHLDRLEPSATGADWSEITGRYWSGPTQTEAVVPKCGTGPELLTFGKFGRAHFKLECLSPGIWRAKPVHLTFPPGGILTFDRDRLMFRFSSQRTRNLPFSRRSVLASAP